MPARRLARVHVIGAGAWIGAGAAIGARAFIGDGTRIYPRAVVLDDCKIGARCIVHSGAVIGSDGFGFAPLDGALDQDSAGRRGRDR